MDSDPTTDIAEDSFWDYPFTWRRVVWWLVKLAILPVFVPIHLAAAFRERRMLKAMREAEAAGYAGFRFRGETYRFWKP